MVDPRRRRIDRPTWTRRHARHLIADRGFGALDRVLGYSEDDLEDVIIAGLRQLSAGVTTVRDLDDRRFAVVAHRDRQRSRGGAVPEPTIVASGPPLTSPGGHCHYLGGEVAGLTAIAAAIAYRVERQVDVIKVMTSGGMTTQGTDCCARSSATKTCDSSWTELTTPACR